MILCMEEDREGVQLQSNTRVTMRVQDFTVNRVKIEKLTLQIPKYLNNPPLSLSIQLYI